MMKTKPKVRDHKPTKQSTVYLGGYCSCLLAGGSPQQQQHIPGQGRHRLFCENSHSITHWMLQGLVSHKSGITCFSEPLREAEGNKHLFRDTVWER